MIIADIYYKYKIMPQLQEHMLKVGGVALLICNHFQNKLDNNLIISTCLLHDMGNAVKFNFNTYPKILGKKLVVEGKKIQKYYIKKYGVDADKATYKILKEISVSKKIILLVKSMGFSRTTETFKTKDFNIKICEYSDLRVSPFGVLSMIERLGEGINRYNNTFKQKYSPSKLKSMVNYTQEIEKQIFKHCAIKPADITEVKVKPLINKLRDY